MTLPEHLDSIATNYHTICQRIADAAQQAGRDACDIALIAISKNVPQEAIDVLLALGHRQFGENRVQEAARKWSSRAPAQKNEIELHLVGALQTNKVADAIALFDVIETLDRPRLAAALARARDKGAVLPRLFVQVNSGAEPQKSGVLPQDVPRFIEQCRTDYALTIEGLMCLPPAGEAAAPHFALLGKLAETCGIRHLSMGMSGDFETAIALGASHVRIGTALFGGTLFGATLRGARA